MEPDEGKDRDERERRQKRRDDTEPGELRRPHHFPDRLYDGRDASKAAARSLGRDAAERRPPRRREENRDEALAVRFLVGLQATPRHERSADAGGSGGRTSVRIQARAASAAGRRETGALLGEAGSPREAPIRPPRRAASR